MADIFGYNRKTSPEVVFSNDDAVLTFGGTDTVGKLIQGWSAIYRQEIQEMYEIGSSNVYWVRGHPMGQGEIQRVVGGSGSGDVILLNKDAYNACNGGVLFNIKMNPGTCMGTAGTGVNLALSGVVVLQVGFNVTIQDIKINQGIQFRFASMAVT